MTKRHNRIFIISTLIIGFSLIVYFGLKTFNENLLYFFSPTDIINGKAPKNKSFRIGGLVKQGSVVRSGIDVSFIVTDNINNFKVKYSGILPDLFRENQGIIAIGSLVNKVFIAKEVLAKHDENYMPPEVAELLNKK